MVYCISEYGMLHLVCGVWSMRFGMCCYLVACDISRLVSGTWYVVCAAYGIWRIPRGTFHVECGIYCVVSHTLQRRLSSTIITLDNNFLFRFSDITISGGAVHILSLSQSDHHLPARLTTLIISIIPVIIFRF